jgi:hypothetical protein
MQPFIKKFEQNEENKIIKINDLLKDLTKSIKASDCQNSLANFQILKSKGYSFNISTLNNNLKKQKDKRGNEKGIDKIINSIHKLNLSPISINDNGFQLMKKTSSSQNITYNYENKNKQLSFTDDKSFEV